MRIAFTIASIFFSSLSFGQACDELFDREADKFSKEVSFRNPGLNNLGFVKSITPKSTSYYLSLTTTGHSVTVGQKGVVILLGDGTKIVRSQEAIDVEPATGNHYGSGDFEYSAFISIVPAEINRIKKAGVTDFKLYIYPQALNEEQTEMSKLRAGCIVSLK